MLRRELGSSKLTIEKIGRNCRRLKNNKYPKNPRSANDIRAAFEDPELIEKFAFNLRKTKMFYVDTVDVGESSHFTMFASYECIDMIKKHIAPQNRNYLVDGTFKVTPSGFYQLLVIHIECKNEVCSLFLIRLLKCLILFINGPFFLLKVIPVFYVLMTGKTARLYKEVFQYIETKIFKLKPAKFMADFEAGLRKAISEFYPEAVLCGCWYHFCAAIRRKLLSLSLYELTLNDPMCRFIYRSILSLPLLPPGSILPGYNVIKRTAKRNDLYETFEPMFKYFESYWLALVRKFIK